MRRLRAWVLRFAGLFGRGRRERDLADELASHLEMHVEENIRRGMSREEARRQALLQLGGLEQTKERIRDRRTLPILETFLQDLRYGLRQLRRNPGFTAVAVVTLALGIGANAAMFGVVNALLLRPLPFRDPGRLVAIDGLPAVKFNGLRSQSLGWEDWVSKTRTLESVTVYEQGGVNVSGGSEPEHLPAAAVSAKFFSLLGSGPVLGRTFLAQEEMSGEAVAVISYDLWHGYLGADRAVVGRKIDLGGSPFTIVGVMPPGFEFPADAQVWIPVGANQSEGIFAEGGIVYRTVARLNPGTTTPQAHAELEVFLKQALRGNQAPFNSPLTVTPLGLKLVGDERPALLVLMGAVTLVLFIACGNVANLQLARNVGRARELAVRAAMGASCRRLIRQMLTESVLLSLSGGLVGLAFAYGGVRLARILIPARQTQAAGIRLDGWLLGFIFVVAVTTGVLSGFLPALRSSKSAPSEALKDSGGAGARSTPRYRVRSLVGVVEMGLALVLLIGAGLLIKSLAKLSEVNPGIRTDHLLTARLFLAGPGYRAPEKKAAFFEQVLERARVLPGVCQAALVNSMPLGQGVSAMFSLGLEGTATPRPQSSDKWALFLTASPGYFRAMGIPLVEGREFTDRDRRGAPPVVIVSQTMARRFWHGEDPVGKRLTRYDPPQWMTVVGVVGDVRRWSLEEEPDPQMYLPILQEPTPSAYLALHTSAPVASADLAQAVRRVDPAEPIASVQTVEQLLTRETASPRFRAVVLGLFAGFAVLLAMVGIYGIVSYSAGRRTQEFGIRLALGAERRDVLAMVLRQGLGMALWGVAAGLAGAAGLTRLLESFLFGVRPLDFAIFASAALSLTAAALIAVWIPAHRATQVDPMAALRYE